VPFLLRVPPAYLGGAAPDLERWGGHRDVFPTLEGLALSEARVFRAGGDLLAPSPRPPRSLARFQTVLSDAGVIPVLSGKDRHCWAADGELAAGPATGCGPALDSLAREERAYQALLDWEVRRQVIAARRHRPRAAAGASQASRTP
jgi:hypothetical protein